MRIQSLFLALLVVPLFVACNDGPSIEFAEPQPQAKRDLTQIPSKLQGTWVDDGDTVRIDAQGFVQYESETSVKIVPQGTSDEELEITLEDLGINWKGLHYERKGDTIMYRVQKPVRSTLGADFILRKDRKRYVMSTEKDNGRYEVMMVRLASKDQLEFMVPHLEEVYQLKDGKILSTGDYLRQFTPTSEGKNDSFQMRPSRKEWKAMMRAEIYKPVSTLRRVKD